MDVGVVSRRKDGYVALLKLTCKIREHAILGMFPSLLGRLNLVRSRSKHVSNLFLVTLAHSKIVRLFELHFSDIASKS